MTTNVVYLKAEVCAVLDVLSPNQRAQLIKSSYFYQLRTEALKSSYFLYYPV